MSNPVYKCDKCGTTSTNPADVFLKYFCGVCVRSGNYGKGK